VFGAVKCEQDRGRDQIGQPRGRDKDAAKMDDDDESRECEVQSFRFQQIHDPVLEPQE
jgi:hypothetical protein